MIIHEEPSPNSVSSPVSTAKEGQPLLYRRRPDGYAAPEPSHCLPSAEAERIPLVQGKRRLPYFQSQL